MLVWVGQTDNWKSDLEENIKSLLDLAGMGYDLVKIDIDCKNVEEKEFLLEEVFKECNIGKQARKLKHSLSVGDVVILCDYEKYEVFLCKKVGWEKIAETKIIP